MDLGDGSTVWRRPRAADLTDPVVAADLVVVASADGRTRAVVPGTGETAWETTVSGRPRAVVPAGGRLFVADREGALRRLR